MRRFLSRRVLGEIVAVTGSYTIAGMAVGQETPPQNAEKPAPSTQPAKPEESTPPATQEAMNERLRRLNEMRAAASRNATTQPVAREGESSPNPQDGTVKPTDASGAQSVGEAASRRATDRPRFDRTNRDEIRRRRAAEAQTQSAPVNAAGGGAIAPTPQSTPAAGTPGEKPVGVREPWAEQNKPQPDGAPATPPVSPIVPPANVEGSQPSDAGRSIEPGVGGKDVQVPGAGVEAGGTPLTGPQDTQPKTPADGGAAIQPNSPNVVPTNPPASRPSRGMRVATPSAGAKPATPNPVTSDPAHPTPAIATGDGTAAIDPQVAPAPPAEPGKTDWISFKDMAWEDIVRMMAKRIGKPYREDIGATPGGSLTYENPRIMTKEEALDELNYLLVEAGYYLYEAPYYVYCIPLNEIEKYIDPKAIYESLDEFNAANPRNLEYVICKIRINNMPAEKVRDALAPALPDYAMPTVPAGSNSVKIAGLAKDVRRFELLRSRIDPKALVDQDPRTMKVYNITTNVLVIEQMVRNLLDVEQPQKKWDPATRQFVAQGPESSTKIIADERTNTLIVKATPVDHERIKNLIEEFDKKIAIGEFKTEVIPLANGNASNIATLLNNIFSQERGQANRAIPRPPVRNPNQPQNPNQPNVVNAGGANPEDIFLENVFERAKKTIRITADDRTNSLIVYANEDGVKRVKNMLEVIDKPIPSNYRAISVKYVDPSAIQSLVEQVAKSAAAPGGRGGQRQISVVADDKNKTLHVIAEKEEMDRIAALVTQLDNPASEEKEHRIELAKMRPSDMAQTVQNLLTGAAGGSPQARAGGRNNQPRRGGSGSTQQVIALDEISTLIVYCTDADWERVRATIEMWDKSSVSDKTELRFFTIDKASPDAVSQIVSAFYRNYKHPILGQQPVQVDIAGQQIVVQGIKPALDEIEALIPKLNVDTGGAPMVILPLERADAANVAQLLTQQLQSGGRNQRGGRVPTVTADGATNTIIYQGDKANLEIAKAFIKDYEEKLTGQGSEKRTIVIKYADPNAVLNAVNNFFVQGRGPRAPQAQVRAALSGNQLLIEAPKDKLPSIEAMIASIDNPLPQPTTVLRPIPAGLDINNLAQLLNNMFRGRQRPDRLGFSFSPDPTTSMIVVSVPADALPEVDAVIKQFADQEANVTLVEKFIPIQHADVNYVADQVRQLLQARATPGRGASVADRVKTVVDSRLNRLGVYAPANLVPMVEGLVKEIDQVTTGGEIQSIPMQYADAQGAATNISNLKAEELRLNKTLKISAEQASNSIYVAGANKAQFEDIKKLAEQIDNNALANRPETRVFEIKNINPWEIANALNQRFVQGGTAIRRQQNFQFNVVAGTKIVAVAPKDRMLDVAQAIEQFDQASPPAPSLAVTLKNSDVNSVANALNNLLQPRMATNKSLRLVAEPLTNTLFASGGSQSDFDDIKKWAQQIDEAGAGVQAAIRVIEVKNANPWEMVNILNQRYQPQPGQKTVGIRPTFTVLNGTSLVVSGPSDKLPDIEKVIASLDVVATAQPIQRFALKSTDAGQVVQALNTVLAPRLQANKNFKIAADTLGNAVVVTGANKADADEIRNYIEQLQAAINESTGQMEVVEVKNQSASEIVNLLNGQFGPKPGEKQGGPNQAKFSVLGGTNIVVIAPPTRMAEIKQSISRFDALPGSDWEPVTYTLKYADPNEVMQMINNLWRKKGNEANQPQVTVANGTLIVRAPKKAQAEIDDLIKKIEVDRGDLAVEMFDLKVMRAQDLEMKINLFLTGLGLQSKKGQMKPGAFAEPTTNTLIVMAPKEHMGFIKMLINGIENKELPESEPKAYALQYVRADAVAANVEAMLKAKLIEREGPKNDKIQLKVLPEPTTNRLIVWAPDEYHELARSLMKIVDAQGDSGEIVRIVHLEQSEANSLANTVKARFQGGKGTPQVNIVPDAASNALILSGMPRDVADAEKLIKELEPLSNTTPELRIFKVVNTSATSVADALADIFPANPKTPLDAVTVREDEFYDRLFVTANKRKMRQVEEMIKLIDVLPEDDSNGKQVYFVDITRGDPFDIEWDVTEHFPDPMDGGPEIDAAFDADYIKVRCRPAEFPKIEKLIKEYDGRSKPTIKTVVIKPKGGAAKYLPILKAQGPANLQIKDAPSGVGQPNATLMEDIWPEGTKAEDVERIRKQAAIKPAVDVKTAEPKPAPAPAPEIKPVGSANFMFPALIDEQGRFQDIGGRIARELTGARSADSGQEKLPDGTVAPVATGSQPTTAPQAAGKSAEITALPDGRIIITGDKGKVEEIEDAINVLEEDLAAGEVIRIFRFRFGDVTAAARILEMMFNQSAQLRGAAGIQQMMQQQQMQQMQMMQQMQQAQQNQRRGNDDEGGRGGRGGRGSGGGGLMDTLSRMAGGGGAAGMGGTSRTGGRGAQGQQGDRLRIATDISHNYLIVKCDESDLPEIRQLLRELDIPGANVDLKVFQLKKLNATETANNIKDVLGITDARQQRDRSRNSSAMMSPFGRGGFGGGMGGMGNMQNQFMELMTQQVVSLGGEGGEGTKIDSVQIVPNEISNSLMVSAPKEVVAIIEKVITELENLESQDVVVIRHYVLKKSRVEDVEPLLQEVFDATSGSRGGAGGGGRGGAKTSPAQMGPVTVRGDTRNNTLIVSAQQKDLTLIEKQIELLDIEGEPAMAETYVCQYGDALAISQTVSEVFAGGRGGAARGGGRGGQGGGSTGVANDIRVTAEGVTNTVIVFGSPEMRKKVLDQVRTLDQGSKREIQEVVVTHADPEKLADKLLAIFGGVGGSSATPGRGGQGGGRGGRTDLSQISGRIVVVGDKISKKLLIRAPKPVYEQMAELCIALDQPDPGLQVQTFAIKHADASSLVDSVKAAFLEYMTVARQSGDQSTSFDAFTVLADPRTNSIMVIGSEQTFKFVNQMLKVIDVDTPAEQKKEFRIFTLADADAVAVADAINSFASGQVQSSTGVTGGRGPGGGGRGANPLSMLTGGSKLSAQTLNVQAVADIENNAVLVFGRPNDIEVVETMVINNLEKSLAKQVKAITVANAEPSQVVSAIQPFIDEAGGQVGRPGQQVSSGGPVIIPNDAAKRIVVRGTTAEIRKVETLIAQFDDKSLLDQGIEIIPVPYGQDVTTFARDIEQLVNTGERNLAAKQGRQPNEVTIVGNAEAQAIMVYGPQSQYGLVKTVVSQLKDIHPTQPKTVVLKLGNLSATDAQSIINDLQARRGGGNRGGATVRPTGGTGGFNRGNTGGGNFNRGNQGGTPANRGGGATPQRPPQNQNRNRPGGGGAPPASDLNGSDGASLWNSSQLDAPRGPLLSYPGEPILLTMYGPVFPAEAIFGGDQDEQVASPTSNSTDVFDRLQSMLTRANTNRPGLDESELESANSDKNIDADNAGDDPQDERGTRAQPNDDKAQDAPVPPPSRRAVPVATQPNPMIGSQPANELTGIQGQLKGDVVATPLDSKTIVITGDEKDIEFIEQILALLETSAPSPVVEVIPLEFKKAASLQQAIDQTMQALIAGGGGGGDRGDRYSIIAENSSNSLIVSAAEHNLDTIKKLIKELDQSTGETSPKLHKLNNIQANEAANLLKPAIDAINIVRGESQAAKASVQAIPRSNSLMLVGTTADIAELEKILEAIDVEVPGGDPFTTARLQVVDLKNALAEDLEKTLSALIAVDRASGGTGTGGGQTGGSSASSAGSIVRRLSIKTPDGKDLPALDLDKPIKILPDKARNALVLFSSEKNLESLQEVVKAFDTLPQGEEIDVKSFALEHAQAKAVADSLTKMFDDAKKAIGRAADLNASGKEKGVMPPQPQGLAPQGLPFNVIFTPDPRSNSLIVIGRKPSVLLAAGLIKEIDKPSASLGVGPHLLTLKKTDAVGMETRLREMLDKRTEALGGKDAAARDNAVLMLDERSNSILVISNEDTWKMVQSVANQVEGLEATNFVIHKYHKLEYADAAKLGGLIQDVFDKKKEARQSSEKSGQKDTLAVLPDSRSNAIVLTGTKDYVEEAESLIRDLDEPMTARVEFKVRPMVAGSAANVAKQLDDMVKKSREQGGGGGGSGSSRSGQSTPVHIAADAQSNSILLAAAKEDMLMLEHWIDLLDRPTALGREHRVIPLARGSSEDLSKAVSDLFKQSGGGGTSGGAVSDFTIFADKTTNSVVMVGPPQVVEEAAMLLKKMQDSTSPGGAIVRLFKLNQADAQSSGDLLRSILEGRGGTISSSRTGGGTTGGSTGGGTREEAAQQVMLLYEKSAGAGAKAEMVRAFRQEINVISDTRTNTLVVTAPNDAMPLMESLITAIDVPPDAAKIRVFPLRNSDAEEMVNMLEKLIPTTTSSGTTGGGGARTQQGAEERRLTLEGGSGASGREELSFTTDKRTNSVIAAGTSGYLDLVERLVYELDSQPIEDRSVFVYHPRNNKATEIQTMLTEYSDKEKSRLQELGEDISNSAKTAREIVAIATEETNRLIVSYDPRRQSEVLDLVRQLDQAPPQVMIQVLIVEVTMTNSLELGVEFAFQDLQFTKAGANDTTTYDYVGGTDIGAAVGDLGGFTFTITGQDFNFLIRTLQSEGSLNVLSRPQIMALDNQEAKIEITNREPIITGSTTVAGQTQTNTGYEEVGIKLTVTPHINPDGFVRMEINQEVSDVAGSSTLSAGVTLPRFLKRVADTTVTVKDNETVVLGGLIRKRDSVSEAKVPILGDIPLAGTLFRAEDRSSEHTELLVILTPRIVRTVEDYRELSRDERDQTGVIPDDVLSNPLMRGLRIEPELLHPKTGDEPKGSPRKALPNTPPAPDDDIEIYGPVKKPAPAPGQKSPAAPPPDDVPVGQPATYDVPLTRATRNRRRPGRRLFTFGP